MLTEERVRKALQELADFVKKTILERVQKYGKNRKGINTLTDSDLINNMKVISTDNSVELTIADYWMYVSTGWKFNDFKSKKVGLLNALVQWALKKVTSDNTEAYRMASSLWTLMIKGDKNGVHRTIPPRPFLVFDVEGYEEGILTEAMLPELNTYIDDWFDNLFETIIQDLTDYFNG